MEGIIRKHSRHQKLQQHFLPGGKAHGTPQHHLDIIVQKSYQAKAQGKNHHRDNCGIFPHIQKGSDCHTQHYQDSPHGRGSRLFQMGARAVVPNRLPHFHPS